jgi:hypothetical protein
VTVFENPLLNEAERVLCVIAPEECLRSMAARGALTLGSDLAGLSPQVVEAVRVIAAGERLMPDGEGLGSQEGDYGTMVRTIEAPPPAGEQPMAGPDWIGTFADRYPEFVRRFETLPAVSAEALKAPLPTRGGPAVPAEALKAPPRTGEESPRPPDWVRAFASAFPHVFSLLEQGRMTAHEAIATIRAIDSFLGNYPTGARYAAP